MFDYNLAHWITFFTAAILLNLSPGPDMIFIISQTSRRGISSGFASVFGIWIGTFVHVIFAALGLSAILMTSAIAFSIVKWIGAMYLIWIGIQSIRSKGSNNFKIDEDGASKNLHKSLRQGFLVSLLNPKVAIFFLAFLPQFVEPNAGTVSSQLFLHGSLIIVVAAFIEIPMILISSKFIKYLNKNEKVSLWIDRGLGSLLILLGLKLATTNN
ncbi:MAG: LysE family translocator [Bacteroidota bacterium]